MNGVQSAKKEFVTVTAHKVLLQPQTHGEGNKESLWGGIQGHCKDPSVNVRGPESNLRSYNIILRA